MESKKKHICNVVRINNDRHRNPWNVIQAILTECDNACTGDACKITMIRGLAETSLANHSRHASPEDVAYQYLDSIVRPQFDGSAGKKES